MIFPVALINCTHRFSFKDSVAYGELQVDALYLNKLLFNFPITLKYSYIGGYMGEFKKYLQLVSLWYYKDK